MTASTYPVKLIENLRNEIEGLKVQIRNLEDNQAYYVGSITRLTCENIDLACENEDLKKSNAEYVTELAELYRFLNSIGLKLD